MKTDKTESGYTLPADPAAARRLAELDALPAWSEAQFIEMMRCLSVPHRGSRTITTIPNPDAERLYSDPRMPVRLARSFARVFAEGRAGLLRGAAGEGGAAGQSTTGQ